MKEEVEQCPHLDALTALLRDITPPLYQGEDDFFWNIIGKLMTIHALDRKVLGLIRDEMIPIWKRIHESDIVWKRTRFLPDVYSEAMCRHSCCYLIKLFKDLSLLENFNSHKGIISISKLERAPFYLSHDLTHYVLMREDGMCLDLTADQFGKDPLKLHHWSEYFNDKPEEVSVKHGSLSAWVSLSSYNDLIEKIMSLEFCNEMY